MEQNKDFKIGESVICNGEVDTIVEFVTPNDTENWEMGYKIVLANNGTQDFGCIEKLPNQ